jgi:hypothetical protein
MRYYLWLVLLVGCGSNPVSIADFRVDASRATAPSTLVTETGHYSGCSVTWTFTANDESATIYYSTGPGSTDGTNEWWENGNFRGRDIVTFFVPTGRSIEYMLWRVQGTTEVWRKESGPISISC